MVVDYSAISWDVLKLAEWANEMKKKKNRNVECYIRDYIFRCIEMTRGYADIEKCK